MNKKIVTLALALALVCSNFMIQPVKAATTNDCAYITQSPSSQLLNVIDPEPKG